MKDKILLVYTGGTICSFLQDDMRCLDVSKAKSVIVNSFQMSDSAYSSLPDDAFVDSELNLGTLSENMTVGKLSQIINNIRANNYSSYAGVIVLHGTDTLAYTAALFSLVFADSKVPIMLVSANRPPDDHLSNAVANFRCAVEMIMAGIAPNVYAPYRNSDGVTYLHIASTLMQCANFSEDFHNADGEHVLPVHNDISDKCKKISSARHPVAMPDSIDDASVMLLQPYTGLDYSRIDLTGIKAIVHGTYHSGTVCVERNTPEENYGCRSILHLANRCREAHIPVYMAPCTLDSAQYSSSYDAAENGSITPLGMTIEAAYAKAMLGVSLRYDEAALREFMLTDIAGEIVK